jgi:hypothetical protein
LNVDIGDKVIDEMWRVYGDEFCVCESVISSEAKIIQ